MVKNFSELRKALEGSGPLRIAVVGADDDEVIAAVREATQTGWIKPVLIFFTKNPSVTIETGQVIMETDPRKAAERSVELVRNGEADLIMKGQISTADLMHPMVAKDKGLVSQTRLLSHVAVISLPGREKFTLLSDGAVLIHPNLEGKKAVIQNALEVARALGYDPPKVAILSAIEKVNSKIPSTVDAAELVALARQGFFGNALISGPLALDNALLMDSVVTKHLEADPVAGQADILIVPELVSGNILYKSFCMISGYPAGGVVIGAKVPVVLTSRADHKETKVNSIMLACYLQNKCKG